MQVESIDFNRVSTAPLSEEYSDHLANFKSTEGIVEEFLTQNALKFHQVNSAFTHLFFHEDELIGFFTLFADQVNVVKSARKKLNSPAFSVHGGQSYPAIRLHYIGVDKKYLKQKVGEFLLYIALDTCREIAESIGINFVSLEALPSSEGFFKKYEFVKVESRGELKIMVIRIEDIKS